ncbi:MAG: recombinase zinc beta ribbon domain-containing protein, partial [Flavonifractor plautii]|nr:recombinase zinc beta ribbon domain-containing protein [Flavonifractor plautii]MDU6292604.1 recombinase zinc beta ribbon domain-containing protein [Flavonifractor plautii]MDU6345087.1 recombinase zinc beta ribbon domain-containing protein [Flavonifractor plautii]
LLSGNVYCGHCGARLNLTTSGKAYPCKEDPHRVIKRVRYICYGKTRKQTDCDGQTGYTAHILDGIIDKLVRQIFERMKAIPKSEIVNARYREKMEERRSLLRSVRADYTKAADELDMLKAEVIKALRGESAFSKDLLGSMVSEAEAKCAELQKQFEDAQAAYEEGQTVLHSLQEQYDNVISWADLYDTASLQAKKMIVNCLIRRVEVYRGYKLHIDFNIDFTQFSLGLDIVEIAA